MPCKHGMKPLNPTAIIFLHTGARFHVYTARKLHNNLTYCVNDCSGVSCGFGGSYGGGGGKKSVPAKNRPKFKQRYSFLGLIVADA